jgi:hypothetical protein
MSSNIIRFIPLQKENLFQRIFNIRPKQNAFIEVNNLFAAKSVFEISPDAISEIANRYKIDVYKKFSDQLKKIYADYVKFCLNDHVANTEDLHLLKHLRELLLLNEKEVSEIYHQLASEIYKKEYNEAIADGRMDTNDDKSLKFLQENLLLPDNLKNKIDNECRTLFVNNYYTKIVSDQRLSPDEINEFDAIAKSLNATVVLDDTSRELYNKFKLYWNIENGVIPAFAVDLNLQKNEVCYYKAYTSFYEQRTVTKRINYGGPSLSIKIMRGLYYRTGSYKVNKVQEEQLVMLDKGYVYLTNKRLLFVGEKKNSTLRLNRILAFTPYSNGLEIVKDSGRNPFYLMESDIDLFAMILSRVLKDDNG